MTTRRSTDLVARYETARPKRRRARCPPPLPRRMEIGPLAVYQMMVNQGLIAEPLDWMRKLPPGPLAKAYSEGGEEE